MRQMTIAASFCVLACAAPRITRAQSVDPTAGGGGTRQQLMTRARVADSLGHTAESFLLHKRLRDGDFEIGDRINVTYEGIGLTRADSLVVQSGKIVRLGEPLGDLNLNGVLRSEISDSITTRVAQYFKDEVVHVTPLIRVSITGAVRTPGTYYTRADMPLSDVIMRLGGVEQNSDLGNVIIKRGEQIVWGKPDVQTALADGFTVDRLGLEPADEVVVGARSGSHWALILQIGIPILTAVVLQLTLRH
jgi:hypothetical protein